MAVRIADIAAHLSLVLLRRRQELGTPRAPPGVHSLDVRNADIEEAADSVWVGRRLERDGRLVVRGTSSDVDDDPAVGQRHVRHLITCLAGDDCLAAEYFGIEAARTLDII